MPLLHSLILCDSCACSCHKLVDIFLHFVFLLSLPFLHLFPPRLRFLPPFPRSLLFLLLCFLLVLVLLVLVLVLFLLVLVVFFFRLSPVLSSAFFSSSSLKSGVAAMFVYLSVQFLFSRTELELIFSPPSLLPSSPLPPSASPPFLR